MNLNDADVTPANATTGPSRGDIWRYLVLCQLGWFACVLGGANGLGWLGSLFAAGAVAFHLSRARDWRSEARLVACAVLIGWIWECTLAQNRVLVYPHDSHGLAPHWMAGLWALFAIQFNVLFVWLRARLALAAVLGAVAGPLSFRTGAGLGAVHFPDLLEGMLVLAVGWTVLMPLMLVLARRWDGINPAPAPGTD